MRKSLQVVKNLLTSSSSALASISLAVELPRLPIQGTSGVKGRVVERLSGLDPLALSFSQWQVS